MQQHGLCTGIASVAYMSDQYMCLSGRLPVAALLTHLCASPATGVATQRHAPVAEHQHNRAWPAHIMCNSADLSSIREGGASSCSPKVDASCKGAELLQKGVGRARGARKFHPDRHSRRSRPRRPQSRRRIPALPGSWACRSQPTACTPQSRTGRTPLLARCLSIAAADGLRLRSWDGNTQGLLKYS